MRGGDSRCRHLDLTEPNPAPASVDHEAAYVECSGCGGSWSGSRANVETSIRAAKRRARDIRRQEAGTAPLWFADSLDGVTA